MTGASYEIILDTRHPVAAGGIPQVSLIVPVFNVEPYVAECLRSIRANAEGIVLELIVIDDGSTDDSVKAIEILVKAGPWPETLFLRQANRGLSAVRNLGAGLARGEYIAFLDSDDRIKPGALRLLLDLARESDCDVVLGRTEVFDSETGEVTPFYDVHLWDGLLEGRHSRLIDAGQSPGVLALEPNANYRLIRRRFQIEQELNYPEGLLFEDAPVHFRMLLAARRIGLLDVIYYSYRVQRPGKITEERSQRRFDVLKVTRQAIEELKDGGAIDEQGGAALRVLFRLVWGCGIMTLPSQRHRFFQGVCALFVSLMPRPWLENYLEQNRADIRHCLLGLLLADGGETILVEVSFGKYPILALFAFLSRGGHAFTLARSVPAWLWRRMSRP